MNFPRKNIINKIVKFHVDYGYYMEIAKKQYII